MAGDEVAKMQDEPKSRPSYGNNKNDYASDSNRPPPREHACEQGAGKANDRADVGGYDDGAGNIRGCATR